MQIDSMKIDVNILLFCFFFHVNADEMNGRMKEFVLKKESREMRLHRNAITSG